MIHNRPLIALLTVQSKTPTRRTHAQDLLPSNVSELSNDPYRSLAWAVKSRKGFKATPIPFAEFIWAGACNGHCPHASRVA
jgi:hypothetical protein